MEGAALLTTCLAARDEKTFALWSDYGMDVAPTSSSCAGVSCEPQFWQRVDFCFSGEPANVNAQWLADWIRSKFTSAGSF